MSRPNWSRGHMAAYIRAVTVPVRGDPTHYTPHHKQRRIFSLLAVTDQTQQNSQKAQEHTQTLAQIQHQFRAISR